MRFKKHTPAAHYLDTDHDYKIGAADRCLVPPSMLHWQCPEEYFGFENTGQMQVLDEIIGQDNAIESLDLGARIRSKGYNIFVSGLTGTGRTTTVLQILEKAATEPCELEDLCYVNNFTSPDQPRLLRLPAGQGRLFASAMEESMNFLQRRIASLFEEEAFKKGRQELIAIYRDRESALVNEFTNKIRPSGFMMGQVQGQDGGVQNDLFPVIDNEPVAMEQLDELVATKKLTAKKAKSLRDRYDDFREDLLEMSKAGLKIYQDFQEKLREYDKSATSVLVASVFEDLHKRFSFKGIDLYLEEARKGIEEHIEVFLPQHERLTDGASTPEIGDSRAEHLALFKVNVILDSTGKAAAPIVVETNPSSVNLFGTVEKVYDQRGFWKTDYTMIKPGALLRAHNGYLVLNVNDLIVDPSVWQMLKRVMLYGSMEIPTADAFFQISQMLLKPEPIEVKVKIILVGDYELYEDFLLAERDFRKMFKVNAEFDYETKLSREVVVQYGRYVARLCGEENLDHFSAGALSALVEWAVKKTGSRKTITLQFSEFSDLVRESAYYHRLIHQAERPVFVQRSSVQRAIASRDKRSSLAEEKLKKQILDNVMLVHTEGERIGQVNGLTIYSIGDTTFGKPARITATVGVGRTGIVNIEREVELSGSLHSKGMLILQGFLLERFAQRRPLAFSASIAFEQQYGEVEGDSATAAELIVLLSGIAGLPVRQDLAITGSVNQKGDIQPIGGVNEKIRGFFEICRDRGLQGTHGVVIPVQNVSDLMLEDEIIEAVSDGTFHIYAVTNVEEAVEIMLAKPAGYMHDDGGYSPYSAFKDVDDRLEELYSMSLDQFDGD